MVTALLGTFAAAFAAAFAGASFAFLFEGRRRSGEEIKRNVTNGNLAIFQLFEYWSKLTEYDLDVLEPFKGKKHEEWLNLPAQFSGQWTISPLSRADTSFLLGSPFADTFGRVRLEEDRFLRNVALIEERSQILNDIVYRRLTEAGIPLGTTTDEQEVGAAVGYDIVRQLKTLTMGIKQATLQNIKSIRETCDELQEVMGALYPKEKIIWVEYLPERNKFRT